MVVPEGANPPRAWLSNKLGLTKRRGKTGGHAQICTLSDRKSRLCCCMNREVGVSCWGWQLLLHGLLGIALLLLSILILVVSALLLVVVLLSWLLLHLLVVHLQWLLGVYWWRLLVLGQLRLLWVHLGYMQGIVRCVFFNLFLLLLAELLGVIGGLWAQRRDVGLNRGPCPLDHFHEQFQKVGALNFFYGSIFIFNFVHYFFPYC